MSANNRDICHILKRKLKYDAENFRRKIDKLWDYKGMSEHVNKGGRNEAKN
jgi:hypothetical protein